MRLLRIAALTQAPNMNMQPEQGLEYHLVVVVEDDRAVRDSLKFSLVVEGFAVRAYPDAKHLLAEERLPDFDCLIVDQNMPGMNGLDLISSLRARKVEAPAILITSHPNSSLRDPAAAVGIPIIEKPLLTSALLDSVRRSVSQARPID
jgi:two-component system, LuxR family, response regulator FixJ